MRLAGRLPGKQAEEQGRRVNTLHVDRLTALAGIEDCRICCGRSADAGCRRNPAERERVLAVRGVSFELQGAPNARNETAWIAKPAAL